MKKILVVEDDPFISDLINLKLEQEHFNVTHLADGAEVIPRLETEKFDLMLLDIELPHKTGFEILEQVRKTELLASLPVIVITNETGDEVEEKVRHFGAGYFLKATMDTDSLIAAINQKLS